MTGDEFLQRVVDKLKVNGELISNQSILVEIARLSEAELFNLVVRVNKRNK
ncbi:MAG: hypothetical protein KZQ64_15750 [gamma proteobacterium symbiont of Bathyaustriella thionipta]|nr:hypothetical protein [gamma proteobacterium symbiont of Bathyaustriella thionipta]MCU7949670.1 hypothetical protein [gamma proteobacterium symbiont of Bathyaustriella thionipta]MCU7954823.1 hypothetical protein [gamma proteobacterium symbiont of Bathyaustriella thionipta]MCU7956265.1 hypothetical protein [gamma proteobacterium symbiont of Bathyaustriella thionipta]MCU7968106.1 hypothetical protein [gamma proteobacterium symbiont of Bathyaustriella thionipta]